MSNKPPIYGFCPAGCKWETVHKSDFDESASFVKVPVTNGSVECESNHAYKIVIDSTAGAYNARVKIKYLDEGNVSYDSITITEHDDYRNYFLFELLSATVNAAKTEATIIYEINGNRYTESIIGYELSDLITEGELDCTIVIQDAIIRTQSPLKVYIINDGEIAISAEGVPTGGTTGQVLKKRSATDYDTEWSTNTSEGVPASGPQGAFLVKNSNADYDTKWTTELSRIYQFDGEDTAQRNNLRDNWEYRYIDANPLPSAPKLELNRDSVFSTLSEFVSVVVYKSPNTTPPDITNTTGFPLKYTGQDVTGGVFTPVVNTVYRLSFVFDGININCYVSGVRE